MINAPKFPLKQDDRFVFANTNSLFEVINFHLKNLLLTFPGEKISDPTYGVGIKRYLFEPLDKATLNMMEDRIERAILSKLRYLAKFAVSVTETGEHSINVKITYTMPGLTKAGKLVMDIDSTKY
tara:strand:- start:74 stop:448 length:375 start_codon:yes stop_codon:yes gene_type:complete